MTRSPLSTSIRVVILRLSNRAEVGFKARDIDGSFGRARRYNLLLVLALASISCDDPSRLTAANEGPNEILTSMNKNHSVEVSAGGAPNFFWLPPIGRDQLFAGTFDESLSPVIQVCVWTSDECAMPLVAEFTDAGSGSEKVRMVAEDEQYIVNWHVGKYDLDPETDYRVRVMVDGREVGFANIDFVENELELSEVNTDKFVGIVLSQTLPLKFRVEEVDGFIIGPDGGTVSALDGLVTLVIPPGALSEATVITAGSIPLSTLPPDRVLDMGGPTPEPLTGDRDLIDGMIVDIGPDGLTFGHPATLSLAYDEAALPAGVTGDDLVILKSEDGTTWTMPPHSAHDPTAGTVSATIDGFTLFAGDPWKIPFPEPREGATLAIAYTDAHDDGGIYDPGVDILIAKWLDTNRSGVPDVGDEIVTGSFPLDTDATARTGVDIGRHDVTAVVVATNVHLAAALGQACGGAGGSVSFVRSSSNEVYTELCGGLRTSFNDNITVTVTMDGAVVSNSTPSMPLLSARDFILRLGDDPFIDVAFAGD